MWALVCLPSLFTLHLFIQICNAIGTNTLYFLPTCRTANIDDDLLGKVQPFATGFAGLDSVVRSPAVNLQEPVHTELFTH